MTLPPAAFFMRFIIAMPKTVAVDAFRQNEVYLVRIEGQQPRIQLVGQGRLIAPPSPYVHIVFWEMSAHFLAD